MAKQNNVKLDKNIKKYFTKFAKELMTNPSNPNSFEARVIKQTVQNLKDLGIYHEGDTVGTTIRPSHTADNYKARFEIYIDQRYSVYLELGYPQMIRRINLDDPDNYKWVDYYPELARYATKNRKGDRIVNVKIGYKQYRPYAQKLLKIISEAAKYEGEGMKVVMEENRLFTARPFLSSALIMSLGDFHKLARVAFEKAFQVKK